MKRLFAIAGAVAAITFSGCGVLDIDDNDVTITNAAIGDVEAGTGKYLEGSIESDIEIETIDFTITDAEGNTVSSNMIDVTRNTMPTGEKKIDFEDMDTRLVVDASAYTGDYVLTISVTAGTVNNHKKADFSVIGGSSGTPLDESTVELGAQGATPPSLLDADEMDRYSSTITSETDRAKIDLIFWNSTVGGVTALRFISPSVASGNPFNTWTNKAATEFKKVDSGDYDATTTQEALDALWGSGAGETRVDIAQGDVILVKTSEDAIKMVRIETLSGSGDAAEISVKGKH